MSGGSTDRGDEPRGSSVDSPHEPRGSSPRFLAHLLAFVVLLAVWTWKLLEPYPVPESVTRGLSGDWHFILAKSLHAGVYAFLTVLGVTLSRRWRWRWWVVGLLMLHGVATEVLQYVMAVGRTGKVTDVLIDWAGITAGLGALHLLTRRDRRSPG